MVRIVGELGQPGAHEFVGHPLHGLTRDAEATCRPRHGFGTLRDRTEELPSRLTLPFAAGGLLADPAQRSGKFVYVGDQQRHLIGHRHLTSHRHIDNVLSIWMNVVILDVETRGRDVSQNIADLQHALRSGAANRPVEQGFPYFAETLRRAGVRRNEWQLPAMQAVYSTARGAVVHQAQPLVAGFAELRPFDADLLTEALRADQAGRTTFLEFATAAWNAGVVRYVVDLEARTCVYYGPGGESYTETYPEVSLPD